jgi:cytochrome c biogenesis protein CcdA
MDAAYAHVESRTVTAEAVSNRRWLTLGLALAAGVCAAGFWNASVADGFGRDVIAGNAIGGATGKAAQYSTLGAGFGFLFAVVAGVAATFTACNCVAFAMIPGLVCARDAGSVRREALRSLGVMLLFVVLIDATYGAFVGWLGPAGAAAFNTREIRLAQASVVFTALGTLMVFWGGIELGLLDALVRRCSPITRAFFAQTTTKAALMGAMVGAFAVGRPFPVFREFLLFTAQSRNPAYGAVVMALQGLGQVLVMVTLFLLIVWLFGDRLARWISVPLRSATVSGAALIVGGAYFVTYWGIFLAWPSLGRWGFTLGLYHR